MKYTIKKSFLTKLKKSYSNKEVARILGYHKSTVSNILSGRQSPSKCFIIKVCFCFDIKPSEFLKKI